MMFEQNHHCINSLVKYKSVIQGIIIFLQENTNRIQQSSSANYLIKSLLNHSLRNIRTYSIFTNHSYRCSNLNLNLPPGDKTPNPSSQLPDYQPSASPTLQLKHPQLPLDENSLLKTPLA